MSSPYLQFAVATDDVMIFSTHERVTSAAAARLDAALEAAQLVHNASKDVNDACNATCLGIDLVEGNRWEAPTTKIYGALGDMIALTRAPRTTPHAMAEFMGSV